MRTVFAILLALTVGCSAAPRATQAPPDPDAKRPRVLVVTAHPDDECAFAGLLYKVSTHLGGTCDLVVITNGEAGFKYATLAESLYAAELTDEHIGRARLPAIRKRELMESAGYLGLRGVRFLDEQDHNYTTDIDEVLGPKAKVWDLARVRRELDAVLDQGRYDFVLGLRPREESHAHHKAATALAAEAVLQQPEEHRPVMLVVQVVEHTKASPLQFAANDGGLVVGPFVFDRTQKFGHQGKLDYRVVANWAITAHKTQGTMQLFVNRGEREEYFLFGDQRLVGARKAAELFERLREPQFEDKRYGDDAGSGASRR
jgi:LmbE family N-acetylglucosaminyl deacetylase